MIDQNVILDTNIVSYVMKGSMEALLYQPILKNKILSISFITVGELYFGAEKANWGENRRFQLEETLHQFVILPYELDVARHYGVIMAESEKVGRRLSHNDAWIAACAVRHRIPLVTHNAKDFESISALRVITNPRSA